MYYVKLYYTLLYLLDSDVTCLYKHGFSAYSQFFQEAQQKLWLKRIHWYDFCNIQMRRKLGPILKNKLRSIELTRLVVWKGKKQ